LTVPTAYRLGTRLRQLALFVSIVAFVWTIALVAFGGFELELMGQRVRSNDPFRTLLIAAAGLTIFIAAGGTTAWRRWCAFASRVDERLVVAGLALATVILGVKYNTTAAAGADAYGYVSQADLWIRRELRLPQPWVTELPWPSRGWSSSPLGYKPLEQRGQWAIVPTYSPGLPLLMAGAKVVAGHAAMFWIVPLCGAALVLGTYGIGCRLGSSRAGLAGAWLTATSPPFVYTLIQPWSDVPAAAAWAVAFYFLFGRTPWTAAASGLAAATAILIRPNLVWASAILCLWFGVRLWRDGSANRWRVFVEAFMFSITVSLGIGAIAAIYQHLYGSPFESGYGRFSDNFQLSRVSVNLRNYVAWLFDSRTAVAIPGIVALFLPFRRLWHGVRDRSMLLPAAIFVIGVWLMYCSYLVFDGWPYLRFLLPAYPLMMIGVGAIAVAFVGARGPGTKLAVAGLVIALGVFVQFRMAVKSGTLGLSRTERRFVAAGLLARGATEDNSIILSMGHSGSARYYAGRMTLRYDILDSEWLDRALQWFTERGVHPYLLGDKWEIAEFRRRFAGQKSVAYVEASPIFVYDGFGTVALFDLGASRSEPAQTIQATLEGTRSVPPTDAPRLTLK
jgi:hypothetical protein